MITCSHILGSIQWWLLLKYEGINIPWKKTLSFYYVGLFFNNFLIGNVGGDLFRMFDIQSYSKDSASAVSTVFLDRIIGLLVLSSLAVIATPWVILLNDINNFLFFPIIIIITGWGILLIFLFNKSFIKPFSWIIIKFIPKKIVAQTRAIYNKIHVFNRSKNLLLNVLSISIIVQSARIFTHYLICRSLNNSVSIIYFFLFIPIIAIIASLPISIGGIGFREQSGIILFSNVGLSSLTASVMEFLAYIVAVVSSLPGGLIFIIRKKILSNNKQFEEKNKSNENRY
jgi:uncharacterized protein (TIRG00374 family)